MGFIDFGGIVPTKGYGYIHVVERKLVDSASYSRGHMVY